MDTSFTSTASVRRVPGIYAITHIASGKQYVGSSANIGMRWAAHRHNLRKDKHCSTYLQRAWNKFGSEAFAFSVLEVLSDTSTILVREQHWIDTLVPVYNTCKVAGTTLGHLCSAEARKKMSEARKVECRTDKYRALMSEISKSHWQEPGYRERVQEGLKKYWADPVKRAKAMERFKPGMYSKECIEKRSLTQTGSKRSDETRAKMSETRVKWYKENPDKAKAGAEKRTGMKRTEETKAKLRAAWVRRKARMLPANTEAI